MDTLWLLIGFLAATILPTCSVEIVAGDVPSGVGAKRDFALAYQLLGAEEYDQAKQLFLKAWESDPQCGRTAYFIGRACTKLREYGPANEWLSRWEQNGLSQLTRFEADLQEFPYQFMARVPDYMRETLGDDLRGTFTVGIFVKSDGRAGEVRSIYGRPEFSELALQIARKFRVSLDGPTVRARNSWLAVQIDFTPYGLEVLDAQAVDKPPQPIKRVQPKYPQEASEMGVAGSVVCRLQIGQDGKVKQVDILTGPEIFHAAVIEAASQMEFTPALYQGKPVTSRVKYGFSFGFQQDQ